MYISPSDIITAVASVIVGIIGIFLIIIKIVNRYRRKNNPK
jgi:uncharacterized protein YneF (UPF0154 family)